MNKNGAIYIGYSCPVFGFVSIQLELKSWQVLGVSTFVGPEFDSNFMFIFVFLWWLHLALSLHTHSRTHTRMHTLTWGSITLTLFVFARWVGVKSNLGARWSWPSQKFSKVKLGQNHLNHALMIQVIQVLDQFCSIYRLENIPDLSKLKRTSFSDSIEEVHPKGRKVRWMQFKCSESICARWFERF